MTTVTEQVQNQMQVMNKSLADFQSTISNIADVQKELTKLRNSVKIKVTRIQPALLRGLVDYEFLDRDRWNRGKTVNKRNPKTTGALS